MQRAVDLPTGTNPGWELGEHRLDGEDLRTVPESLVILQSLKQSRNKWVTSMIPKFSTKAGRGSRANDVVPPPHTIKAHGKYDLHIGPHVFPNTAIYEVHYLPKEDGTHGILAVPPAPSGQQQTTTPRQNSFASTYVTPALSSQVAIASQSNPILANLLNAVINRTATDDQVKTLGLLIKSLEGVQQLEYPDPLPPYHASSTSPLRAASPKPFDIVLEFHERPSDRFILPRGDVVCERVGVAEGGFYRSADVILTILLTPPALPSSETTTSNTDSLPDTRDPEVVCLRLLRVPHQLWDLLLIWAGGPEKMEESRKKLTDLVNRAAPRSYLAHRLPEGELLADVRTAVAPPYTMKSIKPAGADSNRAKRKSVSRKATLVSNTPPSPGEKPAPAKRRQSLKAKTTAPLPIACHACGQKDVPLMMGGRYCRTCIDAGKAIADVPQLHSSWTSNVTPAPAPSGTTGSQNTEIPSRAELTAPQPLQTSASLQMAVPDASSAPSPLPPPTPVTLIS